MNNNSFPIGKENAVCAEIRLRSSEHADFSFWRGTRKSNKHFRVWNGLATNRVNLADSENPCVEEEGPLERFREFVGEKVQELKENVLEKIFHKKQEEIKRNQWEETTVVPGCSPERVLKRFFNECSGKTDVLSLDVELLRSQNSWKEDPSTLVRIKEIIAERPISTILYIQNYQTVRPNNPTPTFFRDYIDFRMFYIVNPGNSDKLELTDKLLKCEFLCLKSDIANPERLKEFEGWGLVLDKAEEKGFDFEFFCHVFKKWYSGKPVQYRFLGLNCEIDDEKWDSLLSMGAEMHYEGGDNDIKMSNNKFPIGKEDQALFAEIDLRSIDQCYFDIWRGTYASCKHFRVEADRLSTRVNLADFVYTGPNEEGPLERLREFVGDKAKELKESVLDKIFHREKQKEKDSEHEWEEETVIPGYSIENVLDRFFKECNGQTDVLDLNAGLLKSYHSWNEDPSIINRIKEAIAGRPISTILYIQGTRTTCPNNPSPTFLREHIDFRMFAIWNVDNQPLELTDKLLGCEFLSLKCDITNPQRLKEFKGWGLALDKAETHGFDFEFFYDVVQAWCSGKPVQWRFLGLNCDVDEEKWNALTSMGEVSAIHQGTRQNIKITREDGETCHIGQSVLHCDPKPQARIYFHLGESTGSLSYFINNDFEFSHHVFLKDR